MTDGGAWCSGRGRGPCSAARPWLVWLATLAVALSATAFIYSSEVYPELPAGLALVGALLVVTGRERLSHPGACAGPAAVGTAVAGREVRAARRARGAVRAVARRAEGSRRAGRGRDALRPLLRRVPPRDLRVADAVQRQPRLRGRFDGHHRRGARRDRRSGPPAVGAADRPALRRRALGAPAARCRPGVGAAGARRPEAAPRRGAGADRDVRRDHDDGAVLPWPHAGDGLPAAADPASPRRLEEREGVADGARGARCLLARRDGGAGARRDCAGGVGRVGALGLAPARGTPRPAATVRSVAGSPAPLRATPAPPASRDRCPGIAVGAGAAARCSASCGLPPHSCRTSQVCCPQSQERMLPIFMRRPVIVPLPLPSLPIVPQQRPHRASDAARSPPAPSRGLPSACRGRGRWRWPRRCPWAGTGRRTCT